MLNYIKSLLGSPVHRLLQTSSESKWAPCLLFLTNKNFHYTSSYRLISIALKFLEHSAGPISCLIAILHFLEHALCAKSNFGGGGGGGEERERGIEVKGQSSSPVQSSPQFTDSPFLQITAVLCPKGLHSYS